MKDQQDHHHQNQHDSEVCDACGSIPCICKSFASPAGDEVDWQPFGKIPLDGIYWVRGEYVETDYNVNGYGEPSSFYTGDRRKEFTALVEMHFVPGPGDMCEAYPVNVHATSSLGDNYCISHFAEVEKTRLRLGETSCVCTLCDLESIEADNRLTTCYSQRDLIKLGKYFIRHMQAMTAESLQNKGDIAAELAWRDKKIDKLKKALHEALNWNWLDEDYPLGLALKLRALAS
jgi:hypothetical protein